MNFFISITDSATNNTLNIDITQIKTYNARDYVDENAVVHYLIHYTLTNNIIIREEFPDSSLRNKKMDELDSLYA